MEKKTCRLCGEEKETSHFTRRSDTSDGRDSRCNKCKSIEKCKRRRNKRTGGLVYHMYNLSTPGEYIIGQCEICGDNYPQSSHRNTRCKECGKLVKDIHSSLRFRLGVKATTPQSASVHDAVEVARKYITSTHCSYCKREYTDDRPRTIDHVFPYHMGGSGSHTNIVICCRECNECKSRLPIPQWIDLCQLILNNADTIRELVGGPDTCCE